MRFILILFFTVFLPAHVYAGTCLGDTRPLEEKGDLIFEGIVLSSHIGEEEQLSQLTIHRRPNTVTRFRVVKKIKASEILYDQMDIYHYNKRNPKYPPPLTDEVILPMGSEVDRKYTVGEQVYVFAVEDSGTGLYVSMPCSPKSLHEEQKEYLDAYVEKLEIEKQNP